MRHVIQLIRKPDGAPAVTLTDSPGGPPVTVNEPMPAPYCFTEFEKAES